MVLIKSSRSLALLISWFSSVARGSIYLMTGMVSNAVLTTVCPTTYQGDEEDFVGTPLEKVIQQIEAGRST